MNKKMFGDADKMNTVFKYFIIKHLGFKKKAGSVHQY
jgi:hypothetical protein